MACGMMDGISDRYEEYRALCQGTNINPDTLLATDYLNHFNEVIMLIEMVADMPDMLEVCQEWQPKTYQDHFQDSVFSDKDLAIAAYDHAPTRYRIPFEATIAQMDGLALTSVARLSQAVDGDHGDEVIAHMARTSSQTLQKLIDVASAIVHGSDKALDQDEIDKMIGL